MKKEVIFIDFDGTISTSRFMEPLASADPATYARFQSALFSGNDELVNEWMLGRLTAEQCMSFIAPEIGVGESFLMQELERSCREMCIADSSVIELIAELRRRAVKVVIATNNMDTFNRWTVEALSLNSLFDDILNSADIGAFKQDVDQVGGSAFFGEYLERHRLVPEDCILIDDVSGNQKVEEFGMEFRLVEWGTGLAPALRSLL